MAMMNPNLTRLYRKLSMADRQEDIPLKIELVATESEIDNAKNLGINVKGTPMRIGWCTDEVIERNHFKPVTSAIMFEKGNVPNETGLFSYSIFGETAAERKAFCSYIDLKKILSSLCL